MFKKLKDKIAEEVKQSPLKSVQQLAQAVVSPSSSSVFEPSSSNDKFCIEEGDIEEEEQTKTTPMKPAGGFTSVALTGQTSSPLREQNRGFRSSNASFTTESDSLFPVFEPQPTNFHVQSDWESASEVEDRYSQLEHISKESLYEAYRKVFNKYNKMKNKYHELVTHYRQLERERDKAKTVLTETQDKALLRISELREQCVLEQHAKAHLEEALRNELEERDHIINTLRTKVHYLKTVTESAASESVGAKDPPQEEIDNLIDLTDNASISKVPLPSIASADKEILEWYDLQFSKCNQYLLDKFAELKTLKHSLEQKKFNGLKENQNSKTVISDESQNQNSKEEISISQSFRSFIDDLEKEVKLLQENTKAVLGLKDVESLVYVEQRSFESTCENPLEESSKTITRESRTVNPGDGDGALGVNPSHSTKKMCDLQNEIEKHLAIIRDVQTENELLSKKLQEEISTTDKLRRDIRSTTDILDLIKSQVKAINETFENGNYGTIEISPSQESDNELIQDINYCLANMRNTIFELEKLKLDKIELERELGLIKDQMKTSESVKSYEDNINRELIEANDKLREELESLQNENNVKLSEKEAFIIEKNELKRAIKEYEGRVKNLTDAVSQMEKLCANKQQTLNQMDLDFNEEKHVLQSKMLHLEKELEQAKLEYSQLLENRDQLRSDYLALKKEKEVFNRQRAEVKKSIKDTKEAFEKSKNEFLKNLEIKASEIDALKAQNQEAYAKASNLEKGLLTRTTDKEKLLKEISSLNQQLEVMFREKDVFENKIQNLEKELEKSKQNHGSFFKTVQQLSSEIVSLKSEKNELFKGMHTLKETLDIDFENITTNYKFVKENREQILNELKLLKKDHSELTEENVALQKKVMKLEESIKYDCKERLSSVEDKNKLENEIAILKCQYDTKNKDYEAFKNEFNNLLKDLESIREKHSLVLTEKTQISVELDSLRKEYNSVFADLKNTKKELQSSYDKETEKSQTDHIKAEEIKHTYSVQLAVVTEEREKIAIENNTLNSKLEQLEEDLKLCKENLSILTKDKEKLASEFLELKKEYDSKLEETSMAKDAFDKLVKDYEDLKSSYSSISESKRNLSEDLESIRKSQDETAHMLNDSRQELHCQQEKYMNINQRFMDLSELFKMKCDDHQQMCQESIELKTELSNANQKVDELNCFIGIMAKEKNDLHNNLLAMLGLVKDTKQIQNYLMNFIFQFKTSFSDELNIIKTKINNDLNTHLNSILDKNKFYSERINELECKTKKAMDSYNSTIKNHQRDSEYKALKEKRKEEKDSDDAVLCDKENGLCLSDYEEKHHDNHVAAKSLVLNHYEAEMSNENLTAITNDWELQDFDGLDSDSSQSKLAALQDVETKYIKREEYQKFNSKENTAEIWKLQQEIKCKDDIIKKLQYIVNEFEQEKKNVNDSKTTDGSKPSTNSSLTQFFKSDDLAASNIKLAETNVTCSMLEQENKTLTDRILKVKEDYEEKLNNLIIDYERKLEEERKIQESGSLVGEKKHMINEMKEQIENLLEDLEERGLAYEMLYEEHNELVKSHEEEIQQVRINYEKEMREQDKKWRSCLDRRLAEEESRHQEELTQMTHEWLAERKELETESRLATSVAESGSGSSELLRRQVQALTVQLHQLQNQRCDSCDQKVFPKERRKSSGSSRSIQDCTEMEYLRNILYEYMMGKEPLVLAKVLCALVKFDDTQTKDIVLKEEQKITLLGQLGILS